MGIGKMVEDMVKESSLILKEISTLAGGNLERKKAQELTFSNPQA